MLSVLEPSEISALTAKKLEEFRFPLSEYPIGPKRNKEIDLYHLYTARSTEIIYRESGKILSCLRIIPKYNRFEKLPIEYAIDVNTKSSYSISPRQLPVCEISGLRVEKYKALAKILIACDHEVHQRGFQYFYICTSTQLKKLYVDKCFFNEVAQVCFTNSLHQWHVLCRDSQLDPNIKENCRKDLYMAS